MIRRLAHLSVATLLCALLLLAGLDGGPAKARADGFALGPGGAGGAEISQMCTEMDNVLPWNGREVTHGGCVSVFLPVDQTMANLASICQQLTYPRTIRTLTGLTFYVTSAGDCISTLSRYYVHAH